MKNLIKMTMVLVATLSMSHMAHADEFDSIMADNQEGKILAAEENLKNSMIKDMERIEKEMEKMQDQIAITSNGDSKGGLSQAGQMIDIVVNTIRDAKKLNSDSDFERIEKALAGVKQLRADLAAIARK